MTDFESILNEPDEEVEPVETTEQPLADEVEAVAESPAPEQAEISEQAPVAEEAQPITREDGATWSENAKRWYKDGKIVAGEPPTPSEPSIPSVPEPVAAIEPAPVVPAGEPWTVRGAGQKHQIPGAFVTADGKLVVEGPENIARHRDIVAAGIQHLTNYGREKQEWTQQIQQAEARGRATADKYNKGAVFLFDKVHDPNWLQELVNDPERTLGYLKKDLGYLLKEADMAAPRAEPQPEPVDIEQAFGQTLAGALEELIEDSPRGVLTADDVADLRTAFGARMAAYAANVDGSIMLDMHALKRDFDREVKLAQKAQAQTIAAREQAKKAQAAAAFNAANVSKTPTLPPKTPKPTLVPAGTKPSGQKPGWDQVFNSAWKNEDDED